MDIELQTNQNTRDINILTNTVTELATIVKYSEKQHENDRDDLKSVVSELKSLNDKIGSMAGVQHELGSLLGEIGKLRHDIRNMEQAQLAIPLLKKDLVENEKAISKLESRIGMLEKWKESKEGAVEAIRWVVRGFWSIFGTGILALGSFVLYLFFNHSIPKGTIGGE